MSVLRVAALAIAAFVSTSASAQPADESMEGVWTGTLGGDAIMACFNGDGAFYRAGNMRLTLLSQEDEGWRQVPSNNRMVDEALLPTWQITDVSGDTAEGTWRDGDALAHIDLQRVSWSRREEYAGPCGSAAFVEPRLQGGSILQNAAVFEGNSVVQYTFVPPEHFQDAMGSGSPNVEISTFGISPQKFYDGDINETLSAVLPDGDMGDVYAGCFAITARSGVDGYYERSLVPEMVTNRWLVAMDNTGLFCGGAHPSYWSERRVFDRNNGDEVDAARWLNESALESELVSGGEDSYVYRTATQPFLEALRPHLSPESMQGCEESVMTASSWSVGLAEEGIALIPVLPHVVSACADTVVLPWEQAEPFLTLEGQAVRLSMQS